MSLFERLYYGKAGKRDYSEMDMPKTRVSLFFLVLKDRFFDLIKLNLLQVIFWIPLMIWTFVNLVVIQNIDANAILAGENGAQSFINTMSGYLVTWLIGLIPCIAITGPSSAGAAYVMRNWARDQHAFLFSDFKDAFKSNWKQALPVSVITALIPVLAYTAIAYYGTLAASNAIMLLPLILVMSATLMWVLMLPLLYPMMIGYMLSFKHLVKNAFLMAAARLPQMIVARLITLIPVAILLTGLYIGNVIMILCVSLYYILIGFAFSRLVYASFANGVFDKFLNPHIEGAQVNQGLRPHSDEDDILDDDDEDEEEAEEEDSDEE